MTENDESDTPTNPNRETAESTPRRRGRVRQQDEDTTPLTAGAMHTYPDGSAGGVPGGFSSHLPMNTRQPYPYQQQQQQQQQQHENSHNPYQHQPPPGSSASMGSTSSYTPSRRGGNGDRPLWQQTRKQSRNLMWL